MRTLTLMLVVAAALATPAAADEQGYGPGVSVPTGHLPPPGRCRVWYPGRPPGQQPAPMECGRAQYEASRYGGRVIYGGDAGRAQADRRWENDRRDPRWQRDDDDRWVWVCVRRDWHGHCLRSERRRR